MLDPDEPLTGQLARLRERPAGIRHRSSRGGQPRRRRPTRRREPADDQAGRPADAVGRAAPPSTCGRRRARSSSAVLAEQVADRVARARPGGRLGGQRGPGWSSRPARRRAAAGRRRRLVGLVHRRRRARAAARCQRARQLRAGRRRSSTPQEYRDRGIAVNVPKGWTRSGSWLLCGLHRPGQRALDPDQRRADQRHRHAVPAERRNRAAEPVPVPGPVHRGRPARGDAGRPARRASSSTPAARATRSGTASGVRWS